MLRLLIDRWEQSIFAADADDRRPQEFAWGAEQLADLNNGRHVADLAVFADEMRRDSDRFYEVETISGVTFDGFRLCFDSPVPSEDPEVRRASARLYRGPGAEHPAIVLVPQWNADEDSMVGACRILNRFGFSVLRMTLPYHEERRPARMTRADPIVSPVLGLTLREVRRAVLEVRLAVSWLRGEGYRRVGLLGTSLGSCIGFLALAHETGIDAAAFNHVAGYFADVVWSGLATRHVRASLDQNIDLQELRRCWAPISPAHFAHRLRPRQPPMLLVSGAYDRIFLPQHGQALEDALCGAEVDYRRVILPCGHYTLGRPPFYLIDAFLIVRFFRRALSLRAGSGTPVSDRVRTRGSEGIRT